jgi:molecular chaperone DnaK
MQRDAELHAEEDNQKREEIEARNEADSIVYRSEKMLRDNADKISEGDKRKIEEAVTAVKDALKGSDAAAIKSASSKLNEVWQSVSAELYKAASAQAGENAQPGQARGGQRGTRPETGERKEDDVVDAEVVEEQRH